MKMKVEPQDAYEFILSGIIAPEVSHDEIILRHGDGAELRIIPQCDISGRWFEFHIEGDDE